MNEKPSGLYNKWNFGIAQFASKEPGGRFASNALRVTPTETIATNGHQLVRVQTPDKVSLDNYPEVEGHVVKRVDRSFNLPLDAAKAIEKNLPKNAAFPILQNAAVIETPDGKVGFITTDLGNVKPLITREVVGEYAPSDKIEAQFPTTEPLATIAFDGRYMAQLAKFLGAMDSRYGRVTMTIYGPGAPIRLDATVTETGQKASALLMPLRPEGY